MRRYEARQLARQLGWRGSKAKRQRRVTVEEQLAWRLAVQERLAQLQEADEEE